MALDLRPKHLNPHSVGLGRAKKDSCALVKIADATAAITSVSM